MWKIRENNQPFDYSKAYDDKSTLFSLKIFHGDLGLKSLKEDDDFDGLCTHVRKGYKVIEIYAEKNENGSSSNPCILTMNGNDERGIVPLLNSSHSTIKIDSLCIKLGIMKEKNNSPKCTHFSIRGYVAGMRKEGRSNLLPFTDELPPMDIPNFRYWLCQNCLQNTETANASNQSTFISVCDQCVFPPAKSRPPCVLPFGEGTSGLKPVDSSDDDETIHAAFRANESQTSQDISAKVKASQEPSKMCTIDTNAGKKEINKLKDCECPQRVSLVNGTISQSIESGQENDIYQNELPRRKARKVRLLKELLCGNTDMQQQKKENSSPILAPSSQIKRKTLHDHHHDHDHDHHKKSKAFKGDANAIAKTSVVEHSRNPGAREFGENVNKYEWNKQGTQRSSILGKVNSDAVTALRSIFSDIGRPENRVPPTYDVSKSRGTEPYSNFMNPPKSDRKVNPLKKIASNPIQSNIFFDDSRRMKDNNRELGLDLSLNYDGQSHIRCQSSVLNQPLSQDYNIKSSYLLGEPSNFPQRIPSFSKSKEKSVHDKRLYTQLQYGGCSGHQKLDFSDPYKRDTGVKRYSEVTRPSNYQRQENILSVGRSDEHEVIELMARNQYERNLCEANNGMLSGFHKLHMNEGMTPSHHVGPMRNAGGSFFHQHQVSSFTMNQRNPLHGVWVSDSRSQRHYDSNHPYAYDGNNKRPQTHLYNPTNMQPLETFNKYRHGGNLNEAAGIQLGQKYAKYSEKDKGKNIMDLDLNLVAPHVVEEHNNLEPLDSIPNRMCSFDSSYSNEAIPAMQLLSLMDAGKSSQPISLTGQPIITKPKPKPISVCYNHCSSTMTEKTNPLVKPIGSSFFNVFQAGQNVQLKSSHGQQVYHKPQEEKSRGTSLASVRCRPDDSYVFPLPWHASVGQTKPVNGAFGPRFESSGTEICTINQNPADFSTPGPENVYMINVEDLILDRGCSYKSNFTSERARGFGPKSQKKVMKPTS
ncbi:hypothetical protein QVD17_25708 [Tagetes erecta]|uniref:Uncharacterized protein n=1 Tax=Tagetes erecta TaxID=13708 RepID=A0AAD8KGZ5_TARER|nr:hypothetical protein QVD17_25708 [Tagetes erecta]